MKNIVLFTMLAVTASSALAQNKINEDVYYQYNTSGFVTEEKTNLSNGDEAILRNNYANDIFSAAASCATSSNLATLKKLIDNNNIQSPIETYNIIKKPNGTEYVVNGVLYEYIQNSSGQVYPKYKYALETQVPISSFSPCYIDGNCNIVKSFNYVLQEEYTYDEFGNIKEAIINNKKTQYLYGYNNAYKITEVNEAQTSEVAYTSFDTDNKNGWSYNDNGITSQVSLNGSKAYDLNIGSVSLIGVLQSGKNYIVSYWKKGGTLSVTGNQSVKTGETINGWQYCEHLVTKSASNLQIQQTGTVPVQIDELRLYPEGAEMQTYTYKPLIGISSVCTKSSQFEFYEYDELGRLILIRDQYGNILKKMTYGLKQTTE